MSSIERAIKLTEGIREALFAEVAVARNERVLIREMDADGLNQRALKRADFNQKTARMMTELGEALGSAGAELGLSGGVTLDALQTRVPVEGKRMSALLAEVRSLAAAPRPRSRGRAARCRPRPHHRTTSAAPAA